LCERRMSRRSQDVDNGGQGIPFTATYPMEVLAWDVMGPLPQARKGGRYIVVAVDLFSRWVTIGALNNISAEELANFLWTNIISTFGPPTRVHSDRGSSLNAQVVTRLYECWGIKKSTTVAYYPQGNGMCERLNKVIQDIVAKKVGIDNDPSEWDQHLNSAALAYNVTPHLETGVSPFSLFLNREPRIPINGQLYEANGSDKFGAILSMWRRLQQKWKQAHESEAFVVGDMVWLWRPEERGKPKKFTLHWQGPFQVMSRKNWGNYLIRSVDHKTVHVVNQSQLKKCRSSCGNALVSESTTEEERQDARSNCGEQRGSDLDLDTQAYPTELRLNERYNLRPKIFKPQRWE
jgi:transposase InsO family protein